MSENDFPEVYNEPSTKGSPNPVVRHKNEIINIYENSETSNSVLESKESSQEKIE